MTPACDGTGILVVVPPYHAHDPAVVEPGAAQQEGVAARVPPGDGGKSRVAVVPGVATKGVVRDAGRDEEECRVGRNQAVAAVDGCDPEGFRPGVVVVALAAGGSKHIVLREKPLPLPVVEVDALC